METVEARRSPLLLTDRVEHLETFERRLAPPPYRTIVFLGGEGRRQRRPIREELDSIDASEKRIILATERSVGEGFDDAHGPGKCRGAQGWAGTADARLDTLFLALPISWRGTLQQHAGRLHRRHADKKVVQIYDYVDAEVPVLLRMYQRRLRGYRVTGYTVPSLPDSR